MKLINLATLDNNTEAQNLTHLLSEKGIHARVMDESDMQRFLFMTKPKAFSNVQVYENDYERGAAAIQDLAENRHPIRHHIFSCPECGSLAVEYPQFTRKFLITPLLVEWLSKVGLFEKEFYCRKCHWTWAPKTAAALPISTSRQVLVAPPD